jgi:hypothetical protein
VLYCYLGDHALYLAYKIARRDLYHWVPLEGVTMVVESVIERVCIKAITDFTGVAQFRAMGEMGGIAWTYSQGVALAAPLVATHVYVNSSNNHADDIWTVVGILSGSQIFFFACFLLLMKREFWGTFFSLQTGHAWAKENFVEGDTDELKAWTLGCNKKLWMSIRDGVKAWTLENWERWEEEKPIWFTDGWKAQVDDDMIPAESLARMNGQGVIRRRSSFGGVGGVGGRVVPVERNGGEEH